MMQSTNLTTAATTTNKLEAEVPKELADQLETLLKTLNENKRLYAEIKDTKPIGELTALEQKMTKFGRLIGQQKSAILQERMKSAALAEKIGLDQRIAQNVQKNREQSAQTPQQYGRVNYLDYLHEVATLNERQLDELWASVQKMRQFLERMEHEGEDPTELTPSGLSAHIQRFDNIFEAVANQVYTLNESAEKLRDCYMEQRKDIFGGTFGVSPFEKRKERQRMIDAYSSLKGVDAFPSPNAILSLSEYLPKQQMMAQQQPQFAPFGQPSTMLGGSSSLFGAAPKLAAPSFSFNQQQIGGTGQTSSSLFGKPPTASAPTPLFGSTATTAPAAASIFGPTTTTTTAPSLPLFGAAPVPSSTQQQQPSLPISQPQQSSSQSQPPPFGFSNTLSSASSGTLFSASPQTQTKLGGTNSLFGGLPK